MKGLTLTQPWATLVAIGAKAIETRSWSTTYRGPVAIHAAKAMPDYAVEACHEEPFRSVLGAAGYRLITDLPRGAVVAVSYLADCWRTEALAERTIRDLALNVVAGQYERAFGNYDAGRFGFLLERRAQLHTPVACRGMLGLWNVGEELRQRIEAARLVKVA
jgi:activating signal cointegrator 1